MNGGHNVIEVPIILLVLIPNAVFKDIDEVVFTTPSMLMNNALIEHSTAAILIQKKIAQLLTLIVNGGNC